jgi:hypothetical protein
MVGQLRLQETTFHQRMAAYKWLYWDVLATYYTFISFCFVKVLTISLTLA